MNSFSANPYHLQFQKLQESRKKYKNDCRKSPIVPKKRKLVSHYSSDNENSKSFDELLKLLAKPMKKKSRNEQLNNTPLSNLCTPSNSSSSDFSSNENYTPKKFQGKITKKKKIFVGKTTKSLSKSTRNKDENEYIFGPLLDFLLTPPKNEKKEDKTALTSAVTEKSTCFQEMLDLWLTPPQVNRDEGFSFDKFINQILSPDLNSSQRLNSRLMQPEKENTKSVKKDDLGSKTDNKMSFKDVVKTMFAFEDEEEQRHEVCCSNSRNMSFSFLPVDNLLPNDDFRRISSPVREFIHHSDLQERDGSPVIGKRVGSPCTTEVVNTSQEVSTQTSFDDVIRIPTLTLTKDLIFEVPQIECELADTMSNYSLNTRNHCYDVQSLSSTHHSLEVLSQGILTLPDGRTLLNIAQVGTARWLESAIALVPQEIKSKKKKVLVVETHNCQSLYVNYCSKIQVKYYQKGGTKVCKIKETDASIAEYELVDETPVMEIGQQELALEIDKVCASKDLICSDYKPQVVDPAKICLKIHNIFRRLFEIFEDNCRPFFVVKGMKKEEFYRVEKASKEQTRKIGSVDNYSGFSIFYRVLYTLAKIYTLLQSNSKLTKREIFYQIKHLVKTQHQVDDAVNAVTRLLGLGPWHLNIISHSGLVYGNLRLIWASGETLNCNLPATLIPDDLENLIEVRSSASFILVVEKESVYYKVLQEDLPNKLARPFILITGKGFPDISTRLFLNRISRLLSLPVFIMVDCDVYGIRIMLTYRFGALKNFHLNDQLTVPNARWLGIFPSEISKYGIEYQSLTKTDKRNIESLLNCIGDYPKIVKELEVMLSSNKKASIEGVMKSKSFLSDSYLPVKFFSQDFV